MYQALLHAGLPQAQPGPHSAEAVSRAELRAVCSTAGKCTGLGARSAASSGVSPAWASPSPIEPCIKTISRLRA